ncbi:MAG: NosD domain-containing protein [Thermoleophilia bacterium]
MKRYIRKSMVGLMVLLGLLVVPLFITSANAAAAVYTIDATGAGCLALGNWDAGWKTCTLAGDITPNAGGQGGIELTGDGITLDGAGYTITGNISDNDNGILLSHNTNSRIRNLNIKNFSNGIVISQTNHLAIYSNNISGCHNGIYMLNSSGNTAQNWAFYNTLEGNDVGVNIYSSNNNVIEKTISSAIRFRHT